MSFTSCMNYNTPFKEACISKEAHHDPLGELGQPGQPNF